MKVGPNQRYGSNKVSPPQELHLRTHGWRKILKYMHTSRLAVLVLLGPFCTFFSDLEKSGFKHPEPPRSMLDSTKDKRSPSGASFTNSNWLMKTKFCIIYTLSTHVFQRVKLLSLNHLYLPSSHFFSVQSIICVHKSSVFLASSDDLSSCFQDSVSVFTFWCKRWLPVAHNVLQSKFC